jgi:hypothetical protein
MRPHLNLKMEIMQFQFQPSLFKLQTSDGRSDITYPTLIAQLPVSVLVTSLSDRHQFQNYQCQCG